MTNKSRFWKAIFYTVFIVIIMYFSMFIIGVESMFGSAIGTAPLLIAIFYYGFSWTESEKARKERIIQTEGQLHEMQEQLSELKAQNALLLALLEAPSDPKPTEPHSDAVPEPSTPDQPQP